MLFKKQSLLQLKEGKNTFSILMNVYFQHFSQICNTEYQSKNYHGKNSAPVKI